MHSFKAGIYAKLFSTPEGQRMWLVMNQGENVIRMETATLLGRPALEAIEEQLLTELGEWITEEEPKKMAGRMARQIMERQGNVIDAPNVPSRNGAPFSRMTRYRRPGDFTFFVFRASHDGREVALTGTKAAESILPTLNEGTWWFDRSFVGRLRGTIAFGVPDCAAAESEINQKGFYRYRQGRIVRASRTPRGS